MTAKGRDIGTLIVVVLKAKNLPNKRHIGKQDPYCSVSLNGEKRRTKAIKRGGQHPEWDEEIRFTLFEAEDGSARLDDAGPPPAPPPKTNVGPPTIQGGKYMKIACWADDNREPDLIGETNVDLTEVLTKGETDEWFALSAKDKYAGEVYLELTFWSNEPAPKKRSKSKQNLHNSQYGGTGEFVPFRESSSSPSRVHGRHPVSRVPSETGAFDGFGSVRSSNSSAQIDLYKAPYERNNSSSYNLSTTDSMTSDFSELGVSEVRQRRDTFPPLHPPRPPSAQPPHSNSFSGYSSNFDSGSNILHERPPVSNGFQPQSSFAHVAPSYQVPHDTGSSISYHSQQRGPRYSLPTPPSGFMSSPTPAPSGFVPLRQQLESSVFAARPAPTPAPMNYGIPQSGSHPPFSSHTPAPSGFMPTSSSMPFQPSYQYPPYHFPSTTPAPYMPPASVPPPPALPPQQYNSQLPAASVPPHPHSAPPQHYGGYTPSTPSPPQELHSALYSGQGRITPPSAHGSRPLPQPSSAGHNRRKSTLPIPPGPPGLSPSNSPSRPESAYHTGPPIPYNQIPPPPPLNGWNQQQHNLPIPPPPPISQSHTGSPTRPNLPQPPAMPSHLQQQPIQQHIPPPPNNIHQQPYYTGQSHYTPVHQSPDGNYYHPEGHAWN